MKLKTMLVLFIIVSLVMPSVGVQAEYSPAPLASTEPRYGGWMDTILLTTVSPEQVIPQLTAGNIDVYASSLGNPADFADIKSAGLKHATSIGGYYELTFNPSGPIFAGTGKLNPFAKPKIREAMNWLIDRQQIAQNVYGNLAVSRYLPLSTGFPEYERYKDLATQIEAEYAYDVARANAQISTEMLSLGASLVSGKWHHDGSPVTLIFIIRNDGDGTRIGIGNYVADQLESIGFEVDRRYLPSSEAFSYWGGSNPNDGLWHLYTGGWITRSVARSEAGNFSFFYTPDGLDFPLWQAYTPSAEFYQVATDLANWNFTSTTQRRTLIQSAFGLAMKDSVRVWLVDQQAFSPWRQDFDVASDLAGGIQGTNLWAHTLRNINQPGGTARVAMADVLVDPSNPIAGSNWVFDQFWKRAVGDFGFMSHPKNGLPLPQRVSHVEVTVQNGLPVSKSSDWVSLNFAPQINVPPDAWIDWNPTSQTFITAGAQHPDGLTATRKIVVHFPEEIYNMTWHDGSPLSPADFIMPWIMRFERGKVQSVIYDESHVDTLQSFQNSFRGIRFVSTKPLVIEYYTDTWNWEAEMDIPEFWPQYGFGEAAWHMVAVSNMSEASQTLAYSWSKSDSLGVPWMDYVAGPSLGILNSTLDTAIATNPIPYPNTLGSYITSEQAAKRYSNLKSWYTTHGHFWVGTGPYYLDTVNPVGKTLTLKNNSAYPDVAGRWRTETFPDVPITHWAASFIERLANAKITSGFPDGTYRPAQAVTRGQMAVFLLKAMHYPGSYSPPDVAPTFSDTADHWAEDWIEALKASGITGGFPDGTYRPEANVTRGQMAIFLLKAINGPGYTPPPAAPTFDDTAEHWASDWIEALRASGLTGGYPDGTYRPDNPVTRAEMAVFIVNAFGLP